MPWYLRSGKCLAETAAEVLVELKPPPQQLFDDSAPAAGPANYLRFRLAPNPEIALAARVKRAGQEFVGDQRELFLLNAQPNEEEPYERLLGDALAGDGALFTREEAVEAAWAVVDPVLERHHRALPYKPGSWGPKASRRADRAARTLAQPGPERGGVAGGGPVSNDRVARLFGIDGTLIDTGDARRGQRRIEMQLGMIGRDEDRSTSRPDLPHARARRWLAAERGPREDPVSPALTRVTVRVDRPARDRQTPLQLSLRSNGQRTSRTPCSRLMCGSSCSARS